MVISAVDAAVTLQQKSLVQAAKAPGMKRSVLCNFGTPGAQGIRALLDRSVIVWDDQISQARALEIADRALGEGDVHRAE